VPLQHRLEDHDKTKEGGGTGYKNCGCLQTCEADLSCTELPRNLGRCFRLVHQADDVRESFPQLNTESRRVQLLATLQWLSLTVFAKLTMRVSDELRNTCRAPVNEEVSVRHGVCSLRVEPDYFLPAPSRPWRVIFKAASHIRRELRAPGPQL